VNKTIKNTDWTQYYKKKKSFFSSYTQRFTLFYIDREIERLGSSKISVLECGGGNSCFVHSLLLSQPKIERYDIIDNNEYAVHLFNDISLNIEHEGKEIDLTTIEPDTSCPQYDFVYSIGLIEHFSEEDRTKVIKAHFSFCKPGGIVLISFPTPTLKYRVCRKFMELIGAWQFWDETPLAPNMVLPYIEEEGTILNSYLNKKLPLSQHIIVARRNIEK